MYAMLDVTVPELPTHRPRYLMGVGMPEDLVEGWRAESICSIVWFHHVTAARAGCLPHSGVS